MKKLFSELMLTPDRMDSKAWVPCATTSGRGCQCVCLYYKAPVCWKIFPALTCPSLISGNMVEPLLWLSTKKKVLFKKTRDSSSISWTVRIAHLLYDLIALQKDKVSILGGWDTGQVCLMWCRVISPRGFSHVVMWYFEGSLDGHGDWITSAQWEAGRLGDVPHDKGTPRKQSSTV